jgi:serine/threonine-protein kinase
MEVALEDTSAELGPSCRVLSVIGRSARGTTFLAESEDGSPFPRYVALKILDVGADAVPGAAERLRQVQRKAARVTHPAFAPMLEAGVSVEGRPYLVYEYVRGLPVLLHSEHHGLDRAARLAVVSAVGAAVALIHRAGLAHGALRPSNVLVSSTGDGGAIRVLDLGEAEALGAIRPDARAPSTAADLEDLDALRRAIVGD